MTVALWVALALTGPAFAQAPDAAAPVPQAGPLNGPLNGPVAPIASSCESGACGGSTGPQFWASVDYLGAWLRGDNVPALVTASPPGTPKGVAGVIGAKTTSIVYGGTTNDGYRSGFRLATGYWFDPEQTFGVEVGFRMLESQSSGFSAIGNGNDVILARPFVDVTNKNTPQARLVAFPGVATGGVAVRASSGNFYDVNLDLVEKVVDTGGFRLDSLVGYRFFRYDEGLRVRTAVNPVGNFVPGTQVTTIDDFGAQNEFNGIDLGLKARLTWDNFAVGLLAKIAVGRVQRIEPINGSITTSVPGFAPVTTPGGFLALPINSGQHPNGDWTAVPELGANMMWNVNPNVRLRLGYSILMLERVARASDQIDLGLNPNLFPPVGANPAGPHRPFFTFNRSDIWIQMVNLGVEFTY
jgi:hypothetical protein